VRTHGWLAGDAGEFSRAVWAGVSMSVSCRCTHAVVMEVRASNLSNATTQPRSVLHYCFCLDAVQSPFIHHSPLRLPAFPRTAFRPVPSPGDHRYLYHRAAKGDDRPCATSLYPTRILLPPRCLEDERPYFDFDMERQHTFQRVCVFRHDCWPD
jgi:hypothetical protein